MITDLLPENVEESPVMIMRPNGPSILVVRVGSENRPATYDDICDLRSVLRPMVQENFPDMEIFVTHHDVDFQLITQPTE